MFALRQKKYLNLFLADVLFLYFCTSILLYFYTSILPYFSILLYLYTSILALVEKGNISQKLYNQYPPKM